jgi:translocator protein
MNNSNKSNNKPLVFFSVTTFLVGQLAGFFSYLFFPFNPNSNNYILPSIYPANWVFIVVWIILYPCMGLSMGHIYKLRKNVDISGVLIAYLIMLSANLMFLPIMNLSKGNPAIMTFMDFNGIVSALLFSWLCFKYSKTAYYWSLPLTIWMPITFIIKVGLWTAN